LSAAAPASKAKQAAEIAPGFKTVAGPASGADPKPMREAKYKAWHPTFS